MRVELPTSCTQNARRLQLTPQKIWQRALGNKPPSPLPKGASGSGIPSGWQLLGAEARMTALIGFHARASTLVGLPSSVTSSLVPDTPEVLARLSSVLGTNHDPISQWVPSPSSVATAESSYAKQAWWVEQVAEARRARLPMWGTARDQVRLENQEGPFARLSGL